MCVLQLSSSCIIQKSSLRCVEVRTLLACVADVSSSPSSSLSASLPVTLLVRPSLSSVPLHLLTVRTAAVAPTRECVQLASDGVYECEIVVQCDSDDGLLHSCDVALEVVSVELCQGPSMEYCERLHWWPALTDTQRRALLPWLLTEKGSEETRPRRNKERGERQHKRKHSSRKRRHARRHASNGSHKHSRRRTTSEHEDSEEEHDENEQQQPVVNKSPPQHRSERSTLPLVRDSPSPSSSSSSSSPVPISPSDLRHPPCCACGYRTTCSRAKSCRCLAAGQRCGHCASDFCENNPKTRPYQRHTIVSRQLVQQYQRAMKQHSSGELPEKEGQQERDGQGQEAVDRRAVEEEGTASNGSAKEEKAKERSGRCV